MGVIGTPFSQGNTDAVMHGRLEGKIFSRTPWQVTASHLGGTEQHWSLGGAGACLCAIFSWVLVLSSVCGIHLFRLLFCEMLGDC